MKGSVTESVIKGVCIAVFLMAIGLDIKNPKWWVAMLSLNLAVSL